MKTIITETFEGVVHVVDAFESNGPVARRHIHYEKEARCESCGRWLPGEAITTAIDEKVLCIACACIAAAHSKHLHREP